MTLKRTPLERRTPLRANPETLYEWKRRTAAPLRKHKPGVAKRAPDAGARLRERSGDRCEYIADGGVRCREQAEHPHHRRLVKQGGEDTIVNLLAVCYAHHRAIHWGVSGSYLRGYLVPSWAEPQVCACGRPASHEHYAIGTPRCPLCKGPLDPPLYLSAYEAAISKLQQRENRPIG